MSAWIQTHRILVFGEAFDRTRKTPDKIFSMTKQSKAAAGCANVAVAGGGRIARQRDDAGRDLENVHRSLAAKSQTAPNVSEVNAPSKANFIALKQRLAGLSANQRALLLRRLGEDKSEVGSAGEWRAIPRAQPLRVEEHPRMAVYPASRGQQRMRFLHHYAPGSPVYCVPSAFHLVGPLNVAWLEAAFSAVIQRHDMLRTTFAMEDGELFQRVAASSTFQLQQTNLEGIPADTRKASAG